VRLLTNLSAPYDGMSVNISIPREKCTVKYASVRDAISNINMLKTHFGQAFSAKCDIKSAFRLLAIREEEQHLQGFIWDGLFYIDCCMIMGMCSSPRTFTLVSNALKWIAINKLGLTAYFTVYMDDVLISHKDYVSCLDALNRFTDLCTLLGLPLAPEKTTKPSTIITFLGITLNSTEMTASLPQEKIVKTLGKIDDLLQRRSCTVKELQSMIGTLNFNCYIIPHGRAFMRRFIDEIKGKEVKGVKYCKVSYEAKQDLVVWKAFLQGFNSISIVARKEFTAHSIHTDAANSGAESRSSGRH